MPNAKILDQPNSRPVSLTAHAASRLLKCSPEYVRKLALLGKLDSAISLDGRVRFTAESVERVAALLEPADVRGPGGGLRKPRAPKPGPGGS